MKATIATAAAAASILTLATSQVAFAQSEFQVLRAGDSQMTCEALVTEINGLNEAIRNQAQQAQRNAQGRAAAGRVGRGLLSGLAQGVQMFGMGGMGGGGDAITNMVASAAVSGVASEIAKGASEGSAATPAAEQPAQETPERQRANHLSTMYGQRC